MEREGAQRNEDMHVTVKMIGPFTVTAGFSEKQVEVAEGTTVGALLGTLDLKNPKPKIVTRNGRAVAEEEPVRDGDRIVVAPIYSGG